jgi:hypothetical protein
MLFFVRETSDTVWILLGQPVFCLFESQKEVGVES